MGHAKEYVRAMHAILQQPISDDYVVAVGENYCRSFVRMSFRYCVVELIFEGKSVNESGRKASIDKLKME